MDAQVGIIRNQAVANGTEDIVELVALLHQAVLYQQAGLGMYALTRSLRLARKSQATSSTNAPTISE